MGLYNKYTAYPAKKVGFMDKLGEKLKNFRKKKKMTQGQVAKILGLTQAHISRVESGKAKLPKRLEERAHLLVLGELRNTKFLLELTDDIIWNFAYFVLEKASSGDRVHVNKNTFRGKTVLFHVDSSGNDQTARRMSDNLIIGLESILGTMQNDLLCTPEFIYKGLDCMVKNTRTFWRGEPSSNILIFNRGSGKIQILNAGMPNMWITRKGQEKITKPETRKWPPPGNFSKKTLPFSEEVEIQKGDTLYSFSDGFIDEFKDHLTIPLEEYILSTFNALSGDAESMGTRLLLALDEAMGDIDARQDISFVLVSRK